MFIIKLSNSTCFGHHYAHHQENKTVFYCIRCSAWVCRLWLAVVWWSCVHCVTVTVPLFFNGLSRPVSFLLPRRMFNLIPSYFVIQPSTRPTPSLYFLLLPSLLLLLKIFVSSRNNFHSSLHYHHSSIYIYIHFRFPISLCLPLFTTLSIPLIILHHQFHPYSTQANSQLTSFLPP